MSNVAVIAEFHPYHNGHHYLFEEAMSLSGISYSVAVSLCGTNTRAQKWQLQMDSTLV